jgi:hypothetical protein
MTLLYLLGFPTPVIEIAALLAGTVLLLAVVFGLRFESVDERTTENEQESEVTG